MSDPKLAKGIVDRAVTRIVTAGTLYEDDLLDRRHSASATSILMSLNF